MRPLLLALQLLAQVPPAPAPARPPVDAPRAPPVAEERDEVVDWFVKLDIGVGTRGFSENSALLSDLGYGDAKLWMTMDGAWMFHEHVGAGVFMGLNKRFSGDEDGPPQVSVVSYFVGVELPVLLAGNRYWAFHVTPRGGFAAGTVRLSGQPASQFQHTGTFGAAVSFHSFFAHTGASVVFMRTPAGPPGEVGRDMDYGGLYFTIAGSIDG